MQNCITKIESVIHANSSFFLSNDIYYDKVSNRKLFRRRENTLLIRCGWMKICVEESKKNEKKNDVIIHCRIESLQWNTLFYANGIHKKILYAFAWRHAHFFFSLAVDVFAWSTLDGWEMLKIQSNRPKKYSSSWTDASSR